MNYPASNCGRAGSPVRPFNNRFQPVNLWSSLPTRTLMNLVYDFHVSNGDNGNVYGITNNRDTNRNQTFTYDPLNRLISAQNAGTDCTQILPDGHTEYWGNNYVYDAWGNLNQKQVTKCSAENLKTACAQESHALCLDPSLRSRTGCDGATLIHPLPGTGSSVSVSLSSILLIHRKFGVCGSRNHPARDDWG
jgi:hypothetical protein